MGDSGDSVKQEKKVVFVTVGTTLFDALVRTMDTKEVKQELLRKGYTDLVIQMGRGSYTPTKCDGEDGSLAVDYFTFSPSIADHLRSASLIISHAGKLLFIFDIRWMSGSTINLVIVMLHCGFFSFYLERSRESVLFT
ncbi:hypothetical protein NC653_030484 [Populus alba x Populus x berolinensis]|uniref:Glycosyl transferase family 28 C-terminal domain-containing protein n=1 Tax=Populus alba x Populus x berolinensis TaxID=444605 RepID=A0AAD6Q0B1_9ROSI|nr:hypothetical protein NC653_030484 [Populus alba x Populus x berolinensis]